MNFFYVLVCDIPRVSFKRCYLQQTKGTGNVPWDRIKA